jgi:nitrite reductase/ring-hydroxylating ferredoxin subunit
MSLLHGPVRRVERAEVLDAPATFLTRLIGRAVGPRLVRNLLSGTYLGHPLHPVLTDLPIGAWAMSTMLDTVGGPDTERGADLLVAAGIAAAVPTAATGLNDWSSTSGPDARVGLLHAAVNTTALSLFTASLLARTRGHRARGRLLGRLGLGVLLVGGDLGGHLTFARGVDVNRTAWQEGPREWTPVLTDAELADRRPRRVDAGGLPVLLYRQADRLYALASTCTHMGGPLDEGTITDGCVTCPWHGSTFRLSDGHIWRGPATSPEPRYQTRVRDGQIEIRLPA